MKLSKLLKSILFTASVFLLLGHSLQNAYAGPLIIITKAECKGKVGFSGNITKFLLTLNSTTASYFWNSNNDPDLSDNYIGLYLYYRIPGANNPWINANGIKCTGTTGGFYYNIPIATGTVFEILLATGSTRANLGSNGSGPSQTWVTITGCDVRVKLPPAPDPKLVPKTRVE